MAFPAVSRRSEASFELPASKLVEISLPVLVVIGKLKLQFAMFGANCVRSARGRCFRPRALRTQLAPKIEIT